MQESENTSREQRNEVEGFVQLSCELRPGGERSMQFDESALPEKLNATRCILQNSC
jgi:hypothetical protein